MPTTQYANPFPLHFAGEMPVPQILGALFARPKRQPSTIINLTKSPKEVLTHPSGSKLQRSGVGMNFGKTKKVRLALD